MFAKYHYLDHNFNIAARVFVGFVNDEVAAFCAVIPQPGLVSDLYRAHRSVVLPDYQGIGLSIRLFEFIGELYNKNGKKLCSVTTHPGLIKYRIKSDRYKLSHIENGVSVDRNFNGNKLNKRLKASFYYIPINKNKNDYNFLWDDIKNDE